jgi:hypothetical protein
MQHRQPTARSTLWFACAAVLLIVTDAGMLLVAGSLVAAGVMAQLRLTPPANPLEGVKVTVEVFPMVAPVATVTAVPPTVKLGGGRSMV